MIEPDGTISAYIRNSEAHRRVRDQRADWIDSSRTSIFNLPHNLQPSGVPSGFEDVWAVKYSALMPVWQMKSERFRFEQIQPLIEQKGT